MLLANALALISAHIACENRIKHPYFLISIVSN